MSPLLTGLAKLTPEELAAVLGEAERLVKAERERVIAEIEGWMQWYSPDQSVEAGLLETFAHIREGK